jgi:hypothetical protein
MLKNLLKTHLNDDTNSIVLEYYYNYYDFKKEKSQFMKLLIINLNKSRITHFLMNNKSTSYCFNKSVNSLDSILLPSNFKKHAIYTYLRLLVIRQVRFVHNT